MTKRKVPHMPQPSPYDHGNHLGPAAKARASILLTIAGKARGSIRSEAIEVRRYNDATLYDRMHGCAQFSDRQHQGAARLGIMWTAAGLNPRVSANLGVVSGGDEDEFDPPQEHSASDPNAPTARDRYRRFMRNLLKPHAEILEAMLLGHHPGVGKLATLQAAVDNLCKIWGIEDER